MMVGKNTCRVLMVAVENAGGISVHIGEGVSRGKISVEKGVSVGENSGVEVEDPVI
jgi:hypothetical protein